MRTENIPLVGLPFLFVKDYCHRSAITKMATDSLEDCSKKVHEITALDKFEEGTMNMAFCQMVTAVFVTVMLHYPPILITVSTVFIAPFTITAFLLRYNTNSICACEKKVIEIFKSHLSQFVLKLRQQIELSKNELFDENFHQLPQEKRVELTRPLLKLVAENRVAVQTPIVKGIFGKVKHDGLFYSHLGFKKDGGFGEKNTTRHQELEIEACSTTAFLNALTCDSDYINTYTDWPQYVKATQHELKKWDLLTEAELFIKEVDLNPPKKAK
ncbi:MAG: hypothetical protein H0W88_07925 [Parachlamydiaceae bacterium]|nr:hypothetical protein [Parachlamydiaceae bacterium]